MSIFIQFYQNQIYLLATRFITTWDIYLSRPDKMSKLVTDVSQVTVFILAGSKIIAKCVDLFL